MKSSSHKMWHTLLLFLKPLQRQDLMRKEWGDMTYYVPPSEKVRGTRLHVPHQIAPMYMRHEQATAYSDLVGDYYCCLLPECDVLRPCRSGFLIATKCCCDQDVKVVPGADFTKGICDQCNSLQKVGDVVATSPLALRWMCASPRTGCSRRSIPVYTVCGTNKQ